MVTNVVTMSTSLAPASTINWAAPRSATPLHFTGSLLRNLNLVSIMGRYIVNNRVSPIQ